MPRVKVSAAGPRRMPIEVVVARLRDLDLAELCYGEAWVYSTYLNVKVGKHKTKGHPDRFYPPDIFLTVS